MQKGLSRKIQKLDFCCCFTTIAEQVGSSCTTAMKLFTLPRGFYKGKIPKNFITERIWRPAFAVSQRLYGSSLFVQCTTTWTWNMTVSQGICCLGYSQKTFNRSFSHYPKEKVIYSFECFFENSWSITLTTFGHWTRMSYTGNSIFCKLLEFRIDTSDHVQCKKNCILNVFQNHCFIFF